MLRCGRGKFFRLYLALINRQINKKGCSHTFRRIKPNSAAVVVHNPLNNRKPQPCAGILGCKIGSKDERSFLLADTLSGISDAESTIPGLPFFYKVCPVSKLTSGYELRYRLMLSSAAFFRFVHECEGSIGFEKVLNSLSRVESPSVS